MNSPPTTVMRTSKAALLRQGLALLHRPTELWRIQELRYLFVGVLNTLFGYTLGVGLYLALSPMVHVLIIGVISNVLAITFSFITYKWLVFQSRDHWLAEYLKSYLVYGGSAVLGILLLWLLVDGLAIPIWLAQGLAMSITVVASYLGHARFTFRRAERGHTDGLL